MTWLPTFVCPACRVPVEGDPAAAWCGACGVPYGVDAGLFRYLEPGRLARLVPFLAQYRTVRDADGHAVPDADAYRALPHRPLSLSSAYEWAIRRESLQTLCAHPVLAAPGRRVLDIGAGSAWLAHCMAGAGHHVVAVDVNEDGRDGLRTAQHGAHAVVLVQADFDALPFAPGQFDVVVLNAALHYAPDAEATLRMAHAQVAPGGVLAVMDTPCFEREPDGRAMVAEQRRLLASRLGVTTVVQPGRGFLTFDWMREATARLGRTLRFVPSRGPLVWRVKRFVSRYRIGRAPATFGVWVLQ